MAEIILGEYLTMRNRNKSISFVYVMLFAFFMFVFFLPINQLEKYTKSYIVNGALAIGSMIIYGYNAINKKYTLFSPVTILSALYITLFFITPMYDIVLQEYTWFGVDLFDYSVKGSLIAFLGYISFVAVYNMPVKTKARIFFKEPQIDIVPFILLMYTVCLAANVFYMVRSGGYSVAYVFSLGLLGGASQSETMSDIGFIVNLSFSLSSCTLLYFEYGHNKPLKVILFLLMFILQVARGFRYYVLQIVLMFVSYYYIRNHKKIRLIRLAILLIAVMIPIVLMTLFRNTIRAGSGMDLSVLSIETILNAIDEAVWDNFRIYKTYYGVIKAVPNMTNYMFGQQMILYTLIMFVPRIIWPGKPLPPGGEATALGISAYAVMAGTAYPNIGEYYYEFGIFGVVFFMGIFGRWMKTVDQRYRVNRHTNLELMVFCTLLGTILQLVIRGYTPSNFWMIVFVIMPYYVVTLLNQKKWIERRNIGI